jgi:hypothetical protein
MFFVDFQLTMWVQTLVELDTLRQIAVGNGCEASIDRDNPERLLHITVPNLDLGADVSSQFLARIGMEFVSTEWAVLSSIEMIKRSAQGIAEELDGSRQSRG